MTKYAFHDIWKATEGTKVVWKVQAKFGVLTFKSKEMAEAWVKSFVDLKEA